MAQTTAFSDFLQHHEVFKTNEEDNVFVKKSGEFGGQGVKGNQMCARGSDLFIAVGNTVRCVDLTGNSNAYKNLNVATVDFGITGLVINEAGTLLAVVGDDKVVACVLPSAGAVAGADRILKVKCRQVGDLRAKKVLKVAWNPVARYDSNLVVLTDDKVLRAYDLSVSYEHPEYQYSFVVDESGDFSVDYETIDDPVSFALGSSGEPHGKMTLYVLTADGDVFGLCPWLPNQFVLSKEEVEDLFDNTVSQEYEYRQDKSARTEVKRHYKQQLAWASQLWKQMSTAQIETKLLKDGALYDLYVLKRPDRPLPEPQGPFTFNPFPQVLYDGAALDIITEDTGSLTAVLVSYSTGRVNIYLQDASLDMKWQGSEIDSSVNLATLESFKVKGGNVGLHSCKQDLCAFAIANQSAYRIDMSKWAVPLMDAIDTGDVKLVESVINHKKCYSDITDLKSVAADASLVKGACIVPDAIGNEFSVLKTGNAVYVEHWIEVRPEMEPSNELQIESNKLNYQTILSTSIDQEVMDSLHSIELTPPKGDVDSREKVEPTLDHLQHFSNLADFYLEQLANLHHAGQTLHTRLVSQRSELQNQLTKLGDMSAKVAKINENRQSERIQKVITRQSMIQQRSLKVLQSIAKSKELLLSDQEKKWLTELSRMQHKVYNTRGLERRIKNAKTQADVILKEVKVLDDKQDVSKTTGIEHDNIARLQVLLAKEGEIVESTKSQLKRLLDESVLDGMEKLSI